MPRIVLLSLFAACLPLLSGTAVSSAWAAGRISILDTCPPEDDRTIDFGSGPALVPRYRVVTVANAGDALLEIGQPGVLVRLDEPFSISSEQCSGRQLEPEADCDIIVRFLPREAGAWSGRFDIPSSDPELPSAEVAVSGESGAPDQPSIEPTDSLWPPDDRRLDFGTIAVGWGLDEHLTLGNAGSGMLLLGTVAWASPMPVSFVLVSDGCSGASLPPGASCSLGIRFEPEAGGAATGRLSITSNDPSQPAISIDCAGLGSPSPVPAVDIADDAPPDNDLHVDFGEVAAGARADRRFSVANRGNAEMRLGRIDSGGPIEHPFSLLLDSCSDGALEPGDSCTVRLRYTPSCSCEAEATLRLPTSDPDLPVAVVSLAGRMVPGVGELQVTDPVPPDDDLSVPFGPVEIDTAASAEIRVANTGTAFLTIGPVAGDDPLVPPFALLTDTCAGRTLAPGQECTLSVGFSPRFVTSFSDTFDIGSGNPDLPLAVISLSGSGKLSDTPRLVVVDSSPPTNDGLIDFGRVTIGGSAMGTLTLFNRGGADLSIGPLSLVQDGSGQFRLADDRCSGKMLGSEEWCAATISFDPLTEGEAAGSVGWTSNDPVRPWAEAALRGVGSSAVEPDIAVTDGVEPADDGNLPFGEVPLNTVAQQSVGVENRGLADLIVGQPRLSGETNRFFIAFDNCAGAVLPPGGRCGLLIRFQTDLTAVATAALAIPSNDPDEAESTVRMSGRGLEVDAPRAVITDPVPPVDDLAIDFGPLIVGTSATARIDVTNQGTADLEIGEVLDRRTLRAPFGLVSDGCGGRTLPPGRGCAIEVAFEPVRAAAYQEMVDIRTDDPVRGTAFVRLYGRGLTPQPAIEASFESGGEPFSHDFGPVDVGLTAEVGVVVANRGTADLHPGQLAIEPAEGAAPFDLEDDDCSGATLVPGATCRAKVLFRPDTYGPAAATLLLPSDDPDEAVLELSLTGSGRFAGNRPPGAADLISPPDGGTLAGTTVGFRWRPAVDPDGDPVGHRLHVCQSVDVWSCPPFDGGADRVAGLVPLWLAGLCAVAVVSGRGRRRLLLPAALLLAASLPLSCGGSEEQGRDVSGLVPGATYHWGVLADDGRGGTTRSEVRSFTVAGRR